MPENERPAEPLGIRLISSFLDESRELCICDGRRPDPKGLQCLCSPKFLSVIHYERLRCPDNRDASRYMHGSPMLRGVGAGLKLALRRGHPALSYWNATGLLSVFWHGWGSPTGQTTFQIAKRMVSLAFYYATAPRWCKRAEDRSSCDHYCFRGAWLRPQMASFCEG